MTTRTLPRITPRRDERTSRRMHVVPKSEPRPEPAHPAERRMRDAGGPIDRACYACECGYLFQADVSTSVDCPNCDAPQAW